jgi:hypothetical protein
MQKMDAFAILKLSRGRNRLDFGLSAPCQDASPFGFIYEVQCGSPPKANVHDDVVHFALFCAHADAAELLYGFGAE